MLQPGMSAELIDVTEKNGIYEINFSIEEREYSTYVTKDGALLFIDTPIDTAQWESAVVRPEEEPTATKSEEPEVELFVMSHCPYGTQAEKGIIPAVQALGDSIDFKIRFVYYAMHGETEVVEQTRQYCIQEEQSEKFLDYLTCFLADGKGDECLEVVEIDTEQLDSCVESADAEFDITANLEDQSSWLNGRFPLFSTDAEKNTLYGVSGSPTLVINGAKVSSSRDPASYLEAICEHFNEPPEECQANVSSSAPSPGFGYSESGSASSDAQCG
jgi:hypothetical protein